MPNINENGLIDNIQVPIYLNFKLSISDNSKTRFKIVKGVLDNSDWVKGVLEYIMLSISVRSVCP